MTTDSAAERGQAAAPERYEREDDLPGQRHPSDAELRRQLTDTLRKETALVEKWVSSQDCFILSDAGKVHLPSCSDTQALMDREAAWAPYLDDLERVRDWNGTDNAPPMPALLTRADVEDLASYTACPGCTPALDHTEKRAATRGWTAVQAGGLNFRHFGTMFSLADGTELGALTRISRVETADGLDFAAEFDGIVDPVADPLTELVYRTEAAPEQS